MGESPPFAGIASFLKAPYMADPRSDDAEVAIVHRSGSGDGSDWIYYDTDGDGQFDLVLYVASAGQDPTQAYRLASGASGLVLDTAAIAGRPLRHKSVFKDQAIARRWKELASKIFKPSVIEE